LSGWWWEYPIVPPDWSGIAGLLAVAAAVFVGLKQIEISRSMITLQKKIAEDDQKLRQQSLRIDLLDKRSKCVAAMREVVGNWHQDAKMNPDGFEKFQTLLWDAQLLFPPEVIAKIQQAVDGTYWSNLGAKRAQQYFDRGHNALGKAKLEQSFVHEDKALAVMPELVDILVEHTRINGWQEP
jgi:hypothetical protein